MGFGKEISAGWWMGCSWATADDYRRVKATYGKHRLGEYLFKVENNLNRVHVTNDLRAADGLWTLANIVVRYDLTPRQAAGMATKMRRAIQVYDAETGDKPLSPPAL
jgi:hypothetical protein